MDEETVWLFGSLLVSKSKEKLVKQRKRKLEHIIEYMKIQRFYIVSFEWSLLNEFIYIKKLKIWTSLLPQRKKHNLNWLIRLKVGNINVTSLMWKRKKLYVSIYLVLVLIPAYYCRREAYFQSLKACLNFRILIQPWQWTTVSV